MHSLYGLKPTAVIQQASTRKPQALNALATFRSEHAALKVFRARQQQTGEQPLAVCRAGFYSAAEGVGTGVMQAAEFQEGGAPEAGEGQSSPGESGQDAGQRSEGGGVPEEVLQEGESGQEADEGGPEEADSEGEDGQDGEEGVAEDNEAGDSEYGDFEIEPEKTFPVDLIDDEEALLRIFSLVHDHAAEHYHAFFSSELGGIITEPAMMMIHIDDHLVHRGHGVFDTALVVDGNLYMLDIHLYRLQDSADKAGLELPCSLPQMKRVIVETVAASKKMNGMVRYWLGGGRGDFSLSPKNTLGTSFYCIMTTLVEGNPTLNPDSDYLRGRKVKTSPVPIKDTYFATLKSTNYLPNVLAVMDAEMEGLDYGIFVDALGNIAEGPNMNVAILTKEGELVIPPFTQVLQGITLLRLVELIEENLDSIRVESKGKMLTVAQRNFNKWDVYEAREAFLIGSTTYVTSIVQWDGKDLGEGATGDEPGLVSLILRAMIKNDMEPLEGPRENFTEVDYGILTNME